MTPGRQQSAAVGTDETVPPHVADSGDPSAAQGRPRRRMSFAFRNWRVRSKLLVILLIPLLAVLAFAGLRMRDVLDDSRRAHRAEEMAQLTQQAVLLARAVENERDQSALFVGTNQQQADGLKTSRDATDQRLQALRSTRTSVTMTDLGPVVSDLLASIDKHVTKLAGVRQSVDTNGTWGDADAEYRSFVDDLLTTENNITQGSDDADLNDSVRGLAAVSQYIRALETMRGTVGHAIVSGPLTAEDRLTIFQQDAQTAVAKTGVDSSLTPDQRGIYDKALTEVVTGPVQRSRIVLLGTNAGSAVRLQAASWYDQTGKQIAALGGVEDQLAKQVLDRTQQLGSDARRAAVIDGLIVLAVILVTVLLALLTVRSLVRPLRRLRSKALDVAYADLPGAVQRMRDTGQVERAGRADTAAAVGSRDEVGEVAEAFDSVHREAVRHAAEQAQLRQNVSTMFVNLSRRTQSLVERQLRLIDSLEGSERDPDALENLFQLDHLATRMRRNAENLLVLAGADPGRRWTRPVALIDVLRAAAAEVEQYQRVVHTFVTGREIEGRAVGDVVHLVAELLENATEFSPPETHVVVSARSMSGGAGVMIEIEDQGIGMSPEEIAASNERLAPNAQFEPQLSRIMGLYVVGRLAARHVIRVQIRSAPAGGITALIHLPPEVVVDPMAQTGSDLPPMTSPEIPAGLGEENAAESEHAELGWPSTTHAPLPTGGLAGLTAGLGAGGLGAGGLGAGGIGVGGRTPLAGRAQSDGQPPSMFGDAPTETFDGFGNGFGAPAEYADDLPLDESADDLAGPGRMNGLVPPAPPASSDEASLEDGSDESGIPPLPRRSPGSFDRSQWGGVGPSADEVPGPRLPGDADGGPLSAGADPFRPEADVPADDDIAAALAGEPVDELPEHDLDELSSSSLSAADVPAPPAAASAPAGSADDEADEPGQDDEDRPRDELDGVSDGQVDLDEDTIVPHRKDEDLPIFAELESQWFLRRDLEPPLPPPPGLPLEEWGLSLDDVSAPTSTQQVEPETAPEPVAEADEPEVAKLEADEAPADEEPEAPADEEPEAPADEESEAPAAEAPEPEAPAVPAAPVAEEDAIALSEQTSQLPVLPTRPAADRTSSGLPVRTPGASHPGPGQSAPGRPGIPSVQQPAQPVLPPLPTRTPAAPPQAPQPVAAQAQPVQQPTQQPVQQPAAAQQQPAQPGLPPLPTRTPGLARQQQQGTFGDPAGVPGPLAGRVPTPPVAPPPPALPVRQPASQQPQQAQQPVQQQPVVPPARPAQEDRPALPQRQPQASPVWTSPADEGWRAAERLANAAASTDTEEAGAGLTEAGLPIRVPMAHYVPGGAPVRPGGGPAGPGAPAGGNGSPAGNGNGGGPRALAEPMRPAQRSPEAVRGMLSSYQRGIQQGREEGRHRQTEHDETTYANQEHA